MPHNPIMQLARSLHCDELRLTHDEVGDNNPLVADGVLYPCARQETIACDCGVCEAPAVYATATGYAYRCQSTGRSIPLDAEDITLMGFDGNKLAGHLSALFEGDAPQQLLPNHLWDLGTSRFNIGRWKRRIFFARVITPDALSPLDSSPEKETLLLIVGSSHPFEAEAKLAKRIFRLQDIVSIDDNGKWSLDKTAMDKRFAAIPKQKATPIRPSRNDDARKIEAILKTTFERLCYFNRNGKMRDRDNLMVALTARYLSN